MQLYIAIPSWKNKKILNLLRGKCTIRFNKTNNRLNKKQLIKIANRYDGIIIGRLETIDKDVLSHSNLIFIGVAAAGLDNLDRKELAKKKIAIFYTPKTNASSVAEHAMALILSLAKNIINLNNSVRKGKFNKFRHSTFDVKGKTLGIIGAGAIGQEIIIRAKSFDMNIVCYTPHPDRHRDLDVKFTGLNELLRKSDFVSINIPLTDKSKHLIDEKELKLMKPTAFLINTSRGKIVNEKSLIKALKMKWIAGAGLDVFEKEPIPDKKLLKLANLILTPHVAGVSKEAVLGMEEQLVKDIAAFLDGKAIAKY